MRICALTVIAEIVSNVLQADTDDKMTGEKSKTRDVFLEHLLDHITDVNVFVRSRVCNSGRFLTLFIIIQFLKVFDVTGVEIMAEYDSEKCSSKILYNFVTEFNYSAPK